LIIGVFGGSLFGHAILNVAAAELDVLFVSLQTTDTSFSMAFRPRRIRKLTMSPCHLVAVGGTGGSVQTIRMWFSLAF
jgi:hypothetical protein